MSPYDQAAADLLAAAAPIAAYCARTPRPNAHAARLDTLLLRLSAFGEQADKQAGLLARGYDGSPRIRTFCQGVRATIDRTLAAQVPGPLRPLFASLSSHCLMPPLHARLDPDRHPL